MNSVIEVYGCKSINNNIRRESSSGGIFSVFAEYILAAGGVVYGTALSDDCKSAIIKRVDTMDKLTTLRGSKYLQSKVGTTFKQVETDLANGLQVLFSGCPCQVNGLNLFLRKKYKNLICIDIICHGVPSPKLWKKYTDYFETRNNAILQQVNFRYKNWDAIKEKHFLSKKFVFSSKEDNPYIQMFLKNYSLRPSCFECVSKTYRSADISIGDFWGVENVLPHLNDGMGTSLIIIRTEKGLNIFQNIKQRISFDHCNYNQAIMENPADYKSVARPEERELFFRDMNSLTFDKLQKKYLGSIIKKRMKIFIKKIIRGHRTKKTFANSDYGLLIIYKNK